MPVDLPQTSPELLGDGVLLSPWEEADLPRILELADDPATREFSGSLRSVATIDDARRWMSDRTGPGRVDLAVRDVATRALIGRTGLHRFDDDIPSAEIGYGVLPSHRRRGVATAAVTTLARWGFEELGLRRVELLHDLANTASCRVAVAAGFVHEGVERAAMAYGNGDGVVRDLHRHARLATDPPGPAEPVPVPLTVPVLAGAGLRLRAWGDADGDAYLRGMTHPSTARWNPRPPAGPDDARRALERTRRRARSGEAVAWAVTERAVVVGAVSLRSINRVDRFTTASYWTMPDARGRGVAPRALGLVTAYAFDAADGLALNRVQLQHAVMNLASCRVATKAGFELEGTQRQSCLLVEGFVDEHLHARVREL